MPSRHRHLCVASGPARVATRAHSMCPYSAPDRCRSSGLARRACVVVSVTRGHIIHALFMPTPPAAALARSRVAHPLIAHRACVVASVTRGHIFHALFMPTPPAAALARRRVAHPLIAHRACVVASATRGHIIHAPLFPTPTAAAYARSQVAQPLVAFNNELTSNYPLHGTGRSGLQVLNHRAGPAHERER